MTRKKTKEEAENEVMEQLIDFDGGAATTGATTNSNVDKMNSAESSKEETQQNTARIESLSVDKLQDQSEERKDVNREERTSDDSPQPPEGEYEVESIVSHKKFKSKNLFLIRWKGYGEEDMTWEKEEDLFCEDLVKEYWEQYNKQQEEEATAKKAAKATKGKSKGIAGKSENKRGRPRESDRPRKQRKKKEDDDWESQVVVVETVTRDEKTGELMVFLRWANGETSKHPSKEANLKCPQKMIKFYEQRLTFAPPSNKS